MVVCDGGADACLSGDSDRTADVDGLAIVFSVDADVTVCIDGRFADRGFGGVFETVDIDCPVNGYGLPLAAGTCDGKVRAFVFCCDADTLHTLRLRHNHAIFHGGFGGILLMHGKRRAAQCGFPAAGERIFHALPEIQRTRFITDRCFDVTAEIHGVNVIDRFDFEIAVVDGDLRAFLHRCFGGVVVFHDIQSRRAGDLLARAGGLCPGIREVCHVKAVIGVEQVFQILGEIFPETFQSRLPRTLGFCRNGYITLGLDVSGEFRFGLVILVNIVHRCRDADALVGFLADAGSHARAGQGFRIDIDGVCTARFIVTAYLARQRCFRAVVAEQQGGRCIQTQTGAFAGRSVLFPCRGAFVLGFLFGGFFAPQFLDAF